MKRLKRNPSAGLLLLLLIFLLVLGYFRFYPSRRCTETVATLPDGTTATLEIAKTPLARMQGLSKRDSLETNRGMLFAFPRSDIYSFWMKDTRIPLDIIWIEQGSVIDVQSLSPQAGDTIPTHTPLKVADTVIELNEGQAQAHSIKVGSTITWDKCYGTAL